MIEHAMLLTPGDKVRCVNQDFMDFKVGMIATVKYTSYKSSVEVEEFPGAYSRKNLELVRVPVEAEIQQALDTLRLVGEVTFKKYKPPFTPIVLQLNKSYKAIVTADDVQVGCQTFTFDNVKELLKAIEKAEAYKNG